MQRKYTLLISFKFQNQFQEAKKNHFQSQAVKQIKNTSYMWNNPKGEIFKNIHISKQNVIMPPQIFESKGKKYQPIYNGYRVNKKKSPLVRQLSQAVNGTSCNPITRINLQNSPKVFWPQLVLLHAFIEECTLYKDRHVCFIVFQNLHKKMQIIGFLVQGYKETKNILWVNQTERNQDPNR